MAKRTEANPVDASQFKIVHHFVGPYPRDRVVSAQEFEDRGFDVARLIDLGAMVPTDEDVTEDPLPYGPENRVVMTATGMPLMAPGVDDPLALDPGSRRMAGAEAHMSGFTQEQHEQAENLRAELSGREPAQPFENYETADQPDVMEGEVTNSSEVPDPVAVPAGVARQRSMLIPRTGAPVLTKTVRTPVGEARNAANEELRERLEKNQPTSQRRPPVRQAANQPVRQPRQATTQRPTMQRPQQNPPQNPPEEGQ